MKKSISISLGAIVLFACSSLAYGPTGHEIRNCRQPSRKRPRPFRRHGTPP